MCSPRSTIQWLVRRPTTRECIALCGLTVVHSLYISLQGGGALGIFPISMSVLVAHLYLIPIDGCSINPTRSFGPYLIASMVGHSGNWKNQQYMFWFAPMIGAAISTLIYGMSLV